MSYFQNQQCINNVKDRQISEPPIYEKRWVPDYNHTHHENDHNDHNDHKDQDVIYHRPVTRSMTKNTNKYE